MTENSKTEHSESQGLAIASLVLGILAIITSVLWFISIVLGVLAIIFGAVSVKKQGRKKAIAGIITGSVGVVLSLLIVWIIQAALPSLQQSQRDTARKNDVSVVSSAVSAYMSNNRGQTLDNAADLDQYISDLGLISVESEGTPTTDKAIYKKGLNCDSTAATRAYAITVLLENGSEYCLGS